MKIIFCLVISLLLGTAVFSQNAANTVFNDPQGLFSLTVPSTWRIKKTPREDMQFEASRGADLAFEYVGISARPLPGGEKLTPTAYANVLLQGKPEYWQTLADSIYSDAKIISQGAAKLGKEDAIFLITEGTVEFEKTKFLERTFTVGCLYQGKVISISFSAASSKFQSVLPEYKKMAASLVFTPGK